VLTYFIVASHYFETIELFPILSGARLYPGSEPGTSQRPSSTKRGAARFGRCKGSAGAGASGSAAVETSYESGLAVFRDRSARPWEKGPTPCAFLPLVQKLLASLPSAPLCGTHEGKSVRMVVRLKKQIEGTGVGISRSSISRSRKNTCETLSSPRLAVSLFWGLSGVWVLWLGGPSNGVSVTMQSAGRLARSATHAHWIGGDERAPDGSQASLALAGVATCRRGGRLNSEYTSANQFSIRL